MSSVSKQKRQAKKGTVKPAEKPITNGTAPATNGLAENGEAGDSAGCCSIKETVVKDKLVDNLAVEMKEMDVNAEYRTCTGVLTSHQQSRDLKIYNFSVNFHGCELLTDTNLELNAGNRYGLIGLNGSGKSTLLSVLGRREVPIPEGIDIFHLHREMPPVEITALQAVMEADEERKRLEEEAERLASLHDDDSAQDKLMDIYERLDELGADTAETRAAQILHGLGFTKQMQQTAVKNFSGGWRMRVSLARALYLKPSMLLLDEPTNHLDLDACVWLEEELKTYRRILVVISHSQDFLNGVCTHVIHLDKKKLTVYGGNYDSFMRTRAEQMENQLKQYKWEQGQIAHMKEYIARFGHGSAKLARQAQSKEKTLAKMVQGGLTEAISKDKSTTFSFPDPGTIPPPVIMVQKVSFKYSDDKPLIYKCLEFGIDLDSRIALVGPNGAGKSTLLKLLVGELVPSDGMIRKHPHVKIGRYHQHLHDMLDLNLSALDFMMQTFPELKEVEDTRRIVGKYGLTGRQQVCPMRQLSDGQRCRVVFAWLAWQVPHLLLLDEPTNHLDMETIDALADAINDFAGGLILVSHDFRLINQVAKEIWVCAEQTVTAWKGDIGSFKEHLRSKIAKDRVAEAKQVEDVHAAASATSSKKPAAKAITNGKAPVQNGKAPVQNSKAPSAKVPSKK